MPARKPKPTTQHPGDRAAVAYVRVSSKEQEKEGFSIPAQTKLLREYAAQNGIRILQVFEDVETAKQAGRTTFTEMIRFLKEKPERCRIVLVEKTDRLYRNFKDYVTLDELDLEIHLVREAAVLSKQSRSSEKFIHGIKVLMAKNYIDNLSEEVRKGRQEKTEQGVMPYRAPIGYANVAGSNGTKTVDLDPEAAPIIRQMFETYARGDVSLKEVCRRAREAGLVSPQCGGRISTSTV